MLQMYEDSCNMEEPLFFNSHTLRRILHCLIKSGGFHFPDSLSFYKIKQAHLLPFCFLVLFPCLFP